MRRWAVLGAHFNLVVSFFAHAILLGLLWFFSTATDFHEETAEAAACNEEEEEQC